MTATTFLEKFQGSAETGLTATIAPAMEQIEAELALQVRSTVETVESVGDVTLSGGGKRLRPALAVLSALAVDPAADLNRLVQLGTSLEMIHMATLIHDDVIDESKTRRGRPTAASLVGNTAAILTGDVLLARAMRLLALDGDLTVIRTVSEAVVELAEGEVLELEARGTLDLSQTELFEILDKKTAALISCSARVGGLIGKAEPRQIEALASYGSNLGLAFQIADDILDFSGDKAKTGKPRATDFREGQTTLPLILLLGSLTTDERTFVDERFGNGVTDAELQTIVSWMESKNTFEESRRTARQYADQAIAELESLPDSQYRDVLTHVAHFVVEREA